MNNRYGTLASWVYNLDKPVGCSFGDVEYYRARLASCQGPVLEPAVGNGRFLVPMLEAGLAVEGFDPSEEMLAHCRSHEKVRAFDESLTCQRFETFSYDRRFEAIVIPLGSFQLITEFSVAMSVLRRFHHHLAPNGRLMVDLDPIGGFLDPGSAVRSWTTEEADVLTLTDQRIETDFVAQTTVSQHRYERWREGRLVETERELFSLRWWGVAEFSMALGAAGFVDVVASGNYQYGRAPQRTDDTISFEARRPA
ncbi:class I SAM-dependent methyltransferase [Arvimicrobium flavum]|uniref:class I SAM-dependent methyltransferase n=1 Tax=Arvimicrobium flavum TaxID=3393320 RepID=UPI00237A62A9|nr:class I SAM-dependent methyltransferase [Mesorhizobium shangrilense]